jgi:hypothetical protein
MPKSKSNKPKKTTESVEYWGSVVNLYFDFCKGKFGAAPSFDGSAPRDLKTILLALKKRAEEKGVQWTELEALSRLGKFLEYCYKDPWLSQNFMLMHLNRFKDKIFFKDAGQVAPAPSPAATKSGVDSGYQGVNYNELPTW